MPYAETEGGKIYYEARGEGEPLLLIMGLGGAGADWTPLVIERLGEKFRCVTYDHRGCGRSDPPVQEVTMASMAGDAERVLEELGIETAHVAGVSMGGMIAQRLALDRPRRIDRLALIATHCGAPEAIHSEPEAMKLIADPQPGREGIRRTVVGLSAPGLEEREGERLEAYLDDCAARPTRFRILQGQMQAIATDSRFEELEKISSPTLVVTGDSDLLVPPRNARMLHERIAGSRLVRLEGCGHMVMLERPEPLLEALTEFFQ